MGRRVVGWLAWASMALIAGCGGGGGGSDGGGGSGGNPTPLPNQICDSSNRICISVDRLIILVDGTTTFTVSTKNGSGGAEGNINIALNVGEAIQIEGPTTVTTNDQGIYQGTLRGALGGSALLSATRPGPISASVRMSVQGAGATATVTRTFTPGGPGAPTPTPMSVAAVTTIFMETDPFTVSSQNGGTVNVYAFAFDQDNRPINGVSIIFDFTPKVGELRPIATTTRRVTFPDGDVQDGVAHVQIVIPASVASPGTVTVTARAGQITGSVAFNITPGAATVRVATVLAQISDATCGADVGGGLTISAIVFDADNRPINDVNVLFVTPVGEVIPLTDISEPINGQGGTAQSTLQIPAGAPVLSDDSGNILPYTISARAGGVEGSVQLFIVPGREECRAGPGGNTEIGEAASVTMSASPNRVRVRGAGAREVSSIVATVFDNQGARLNDAEVRFRIRPSNSASGALLLPTNLREGYCSAPVGVACGNADECDPGATCNVDPRNRLVSFTDRAGNAQIQLRSGSGLGTVSVVAEIPSDLGEEFTEPCTDPRTPGERCIISTGLVVTVTAGLPGQLSVVVNSESIFNNSGTDLTTISAIVTDASGNTVEDGTPVSFTIVPFDGEDDDSRRIGIVGFPVTNSAPPCDVTQFEQQTGLPVTVQPGVATTCLTFPTVQAGTLVQVHAESGNITATSIVTLPGLVGNIIALANPAEVTVTDSMPGSSVITAVVRDADLNPIANARIAFQAPLGSFGDGVPPQLAYDRTGDDGIASVTLTIPPGVEEQEINVSVYGGGIPPQLSVDVPISISSSGNTPGAGQPQAITLASATPATIGVQGSGRETQSIVAVRVADRLNTPLANIPVNFLINAVGGAQITPSQAFTDEEGIARTTVVAGTLATAVQVTATIDVNDDGIFELVNQFTAVNVIGGLPNADRFSLAAEFANVAGRVVFGLENQVTAFLNDHAGNAVAPGTAVNFVTNGASVFGQTATDNAGRAVTTLISEGGVADNGIVTVLATTRGEESFIDSNGNGTHDTNEVFTDAPEPFIDANFNGRFDAPEAFTDQNDNGRFDAGEPFTDQNANGQYDLNADERFVDVNGNSSWDAAQTPGIWDANALLMASIDVTFSGHTQAVLTPPTFSIVDGGSQLFTLLVSDADLNPLVGGSTINISLSGEGAEIIGIPGSIVLPDAQTFGSLVTGLNSFSFFVVDAEEGAPTTTEDIAVNVQVTSAGGDGAGGNGSAFVSSIGELLPPPTGTGIPTPTVTPTQTLTPTPTDTFTPTLTNTPTLTATPTATASATPTDTPGLPSVSPQQATLLAGVNGAPSCDGSSQQFTINGARPPFALSATGGCLSTTSVGAGGVVTFTAGGTIGEAMLSVTDALDRTINVPIIVQGALAEFIHVDLFVDRRNDNGDGTFTSVVGALVTDSAGVTVPDGVPVTFTLVTPVSGVSVTSPGFTNRAAPCSVGSLGIVPQPGDALSCIKYAQSLQGTTVQVRARLRSADGSIIEDVETITLPDLRPATVTATQPTATATPTGTTTETATPTITGTQPATNTATATATPTLPAASVQFISALPTSIGVRASGLAEQSVLTFRVTDVNSNPVGGRSVTFSVNSIGGETVNPATGVTNALGQVTTTLTSGTRTTTVQVLARVDANDDGTPDFSAQSTAVTITGAPPAQTRFSIAPVRLNVAGRVTFGIENEVSAFVNDRFGNAVPPGTSVSFVTNGASIVNPSTTDVSGVATATLITEGQVPPTGIVTIVGFTRGEEGFLDNNGNGRFDAGDTISTDNVAEPFIDFRPLPPGDAGCPLPAPSPLCNFAFDPATLFEQFIDAGSLNGIWDSQGTGGTWDDDILVWDTATVTFSGPLQTPVATAGDGQPVDNFVLPDGGSLSFSLRVHDDLLNPLVGGSTITVQSNAGTIIGGAITVPDGQSFNQLVTGLTRFSFILIDEPGGMDPAPVSITVTVASPNGGSSTIVASGTILPEM
jgi:hypothetical protein